MQILHGISAMCLGTTGCYDPLPFQVKEIRNVMDTVGLGLIVARRKAMQLETNPSPAAAFRCDVPELEPADTVEEKILDFLEGRTHGEDLLHALHDYVLQEPVP